MTEQIKNLQIRYTGNNWSEYRMNSRIQRDMWSAVKYSLRLAQLLERKKLIKSARKGKDWKPLIQQAQRQKAVANYRPRVIGRRGRIC